MARIDRFMIAPINSGLQTDVRPWLIPDDAFSSLTDAYVFRGRVRKRFGSYLMNQSVSSSVAQLFSRLRINLGNTPGPLNLPGDASQLKIGQMFSVGSDMFTVWQLGAGVTTLSTNVAITCTINSTTNPNTVTFVGAPAATPVYYYPANPVMGFVTYESDQINDEPVFAFDTQFAYQYVSNAWERLSAEASAGASVWTGSDSQFMWGYTYRGITNADYFLFVTNFNAPDLLRYWDGTQWNFLHPAFNAAGDTIETARLVVPFKDRLVLLNTVENISASNQSFVNRCRFSQNGSPVASDAWREDLAGKGGYIDAPTKEQIVTSEFLKDRLIVYFESSTWELVYTGNEILPFRWQQINTELGAESTFSSVPFDKVVLGVGNVGVHACNGANVERIDQKIPDSVFEISNENQGVFRVYGIRDYFVEMVYWTFPSEDRAKVFPNRVLVYNYKTGSWAFNRDTITAFGYYQRQNSITWATNSQTWEQSIEPWNSGTLQSQFRQIVAGNQEGYIFIVDPEVARNAPAIQITNISVSGNRVTITAINHNFDIDDYIIIENTQGITGLNGNVYQVQQVTTNTLVILQTGVTGTYTGGGTIARISGIDIVTKQYNFYVDQGRNAMINKVDFYVDKTSDGQVTVDYQVSSSSLSMLEGGAASGALIGTGVLETSPYALIPLEDTQDRLWHPVYPMADGECIQLHIYLNEDQITNTDIAWSDFELHAMTFYTSPTSSRLQ